MENSSILKSPPILRGGNLSHYCDRTPSSIAWGPAGTGKTLASLFKLVHLALMFPATRWFIVRKTKASLAESALVTLERDVFGESSPVLTNRPLMRKNRDYYELPNKSVIVCAGMDKPEKLFSTEYNGGYIQEATELESDEWQSLKRALRAPYKTAIRLKGQETPRPFYQLWGDCNPSYSHHWIKKAIDAELVAGHQSRHEDNPRFHDGTTWTEDGSLYLENQLGTLTGFMRSRLLEGKWAAAEGLVYDEFDERIHVLPPSFTIPPSWPRYWSIDWGWTDPLTLLMFAKDGDGRLYLYREFYQTARLVEDVAKWALEEVKTGREPRPRAIVCDHDPENAATFAKHFGLMQPELADKMDKKGGIQKVKERFRVQGDGKPRLFIAKGCLTHPADKRLATAGKPTTIREELLSYCWNPDKDEPQDGNDHSCDAMLYAVRYVDANAWSWGIR